MTKLTEVHAEPHEEERQEVERREVERREVEPKDPVAYPKYPHRVEGARVRSYEIFEAAPEETSELP